MYIARRHRELLGGNQGNLRNLFIKSMVSQIYDGSWITLDCRKKLAKQQWVYQGSQDCVFWGTYSQSNKDKAKGSLCETQKDHFVKQVKPVCTYVLYMYCIYMYKSTCEEGSPRVISTLVADCTCRLKMTYLH